MGFSDIFKGKQYKGELEILQQKYDELEALLTPEMKNALALQKKIRELEQDIQSEQKEIESLDKAISDKQKHICLLDNTISNKKSEIVSLDDEILVQEFGLYEPYFDFANALDYKEELAKIRSKQKELIKNKTAVSGATEWTVNGSASKGKKMVSEDRKSVV